VLVKQGRLEDAAVSFRRALEVARAQGARGFEARASASLKMVSG